MMKKISAGILLYRKNKQGTNTCWFISADLPGKNKQAGAWSIPKGEKLKKKSPWINQAMCNMIPGEIKK
jgi:predicted NUDIX family NTP pyrophosphohydrolase